MRGRDGGGRVGEECSMSCCIRNEERVGGRWCRQLGHQGVRCISLLLCIRQGSDDWG